MHIRIKERVSIDLPMDYRTVLLTAGIRESNEHKLENILERRIVFLYRGIIAFRNSKDRDSNTELYASSISVEDAVDALERDYLEKGNEYVVSQLYRVGELNLAPEIYQVCGGISDKDICDELSCESNTEKELE